ncbi:unnamed protein product [Thlaspi arvense]|uniref:Uncharacterized protein n=1 Tax=Thlaspi arvense TaxID=13288 RepID=A0AAU9T888_THLAR|nr:unnamed protein product [Thlaspi arvense]
MGESSQSTQPLEKDVRTCSLINKAKGTYFDIKTHLSLLPICNHQSFSFNILHILSLSLLVFDQKKMEIQARLMEYKFHFMVAIIVSVIMASLVYAAPRILDILAYFWPLFASTAAFLAIAITFGGFQQFSEEVAGEGIMDYVAGRPEDSHKYE